MLEIGQDRWIYWQQQQNVGLEQCRLSRNLWGIIAEGRLLSNDSNGPVALHYRLELDQNWNFSSIHIRRDVPKLLELVIQLDQDGKKYQVNGITDETLNDCHFVFLPFSPICQNLLALRSQTQETSLQKTNDLTLISIRLPDLKISLTKAHLTPTGPQRYLWHHAHKQEQFDLNQQGLIVTYCDQFKRIET